MTPRPTHNTELSFIKPHWKGNPVDDKGRYINLDGPSEKSYRDLFKWQFGPKPLRSLKSRQQTNVMVIANSSLLKDRRDGITWLGHATFLFTLGGKHIITDPVLYHVSLLKRFTALPLAVHELNSIDYIILSHNHRDHCDQRSLTELCSYNPGAVILTSLGITPLLRKWKIANPVIEAGWYQAYPEMEELHITHLPAKHWSRRGLSDLNEMLWGSFIISHGNTTIYFGADSGMGIHFAETAAMFPTIDYALLGIGAYEPYWFMRESHTSPADALTAFSALGASCFIPMHFGTFDLSDEPVYYPLQQLNHLEQEQEVDGVTPLDIGNKLLIG